jgi:hypothetical protein
VRSAQHAWPALNASCQRGAQKDLVILSLIPARLMAANYLVPASKTASAAALCSISAKSRRLVMASLTVLSRLCSRLTVNVKGILSFRYVDIKMHIDGIVHDRVDFLK